MQLTGKLSTSQLNQNLGSDVPEQVLDVLPDEGVLHDGLPVHLSK